MSPSELTPSPESELDSHFGANQGSPLASTAAATDARLAIVGASDPARPSRWQTLLSELLVAIEGA